MCVAAWFGFADSPERLPDVGVSEFVYSAFGLGKGRL